MSRRVLMIPAQSNPYQALLARALRDQGIHVRLGAGPSRFPIAPILLAWLHAGAPRVIHLHWAHRYLLPILGRRRWAARRTLVELRLLRRLGVRFVWTLHNVGEHDGSGSRLEMRFSRQLVKLSDAVICHCEASRQAAIDAYELPADLHGRLQVVAHGNYTGWYADTLDRPAARAELGIDTTARVFLFIGQVRRYKGVEDLLRAFRDRPEPDLRLVIAGMPRSAIEQAEIEQEAALDPRVTLSLELVPDDRMQVYLRAADAVVLPYRDVLTSGSAILAMTFGQPVIAPAIGCLPESLGSEGTILYDAAAPDGLDRALATALTADLEALSARALAHAATLDWGPIGAHTAALYGWPSPKV